MNKAQKLLVNAAQKFEMPSDVLAGMPRMEVIGTGEFALEKHSGLLEYSKQKICVMTSIGPVSVVGNNLEIRQMGGSRISIIGKISQLILPEEHDE